MRLPLVALFFALASACNPAPAESVTCPPAPVCPAAPSSAPVASAPPSAATSSEPPPLPPAFERALDAAAKAIAANDAAAIDAQIAAATSAAGDDPHLRFAVAHLEAARFAAAGDFERAAAAFVALIPTLAKHPELSDEFSAHNAMMMIREAQGDPAAALAENDQATLCAARGTWEPELRDTLAFQKDRWHRAYLSRMLAEARTGTTKAALVAYAQAALDDYRTRGFANSIAVLEAYFAALDGKRDAALAAAKRVDLTKDDDMEDLYLVAVALDVGGDHSAAQSIRQSIRNGPPLRMSRAIMTRWIDLDAKGGGFTPLHASAR
jgi:tetratricopeptide (TPR) repeat protein